jgi:sugar lactone lactonase YvrE
MNGAYKVAYLVFAALFGSCFKPPPALADNLYVSTGNIYEFDSSGNESLFANSGLNYPLGLALDGSGNLYVANAGNNTIEEFNSSGVGSVFATSGLDYPVGLAFDSSGNLYVANAGNNTIEEFNSNGTGSVFATASSGLDLPGGLAFDSSGNLYVANENTVEEFNTNGVGSVFATAASGINNPYGLAFYDGNLYVANGGSADILKIKPDGTSSVFTSTNLVSEPIGLTFDSSGNLYVGNNGDADILKVNSSGNVSVFASGLGDARFLADQVPEPSSLLLLGLAAVSLWPLLKRNRRG